MVNGQIAISKIAELNSRRHDAGTGELLRLQSFLISNVPLSEALQVAPRGLSRGGKLFHCLRPF